MINDQPGVRASPPSAPRLMTLLAIPAVHKTIAVDACLPFVYALYHRLNPGTLTLPSGAAAWASSSPS